MYLNYRLLQEAIEKPLTYSLTSGFFGSGYALVRGMFFAYIGIETTQAGGIVVPVSSCIFSGLMSAYKKLGHLITEAKKSDDPQQTARVFQKCLTVMVLYGTVASALGFNSGTLLHRIGIDKSISEKSNDYLFNYTIGCIPSFLCACYDQLFAIYEKKHFNFTLQGIDVFGKIVLGGSLVMLYHYGIRGIAIAHSTFAFVSLFLSIGLTIGISDLNQLQLYHFPPTSHLNLQEFSWSDFCCETLYLFIISFLPVLQRLCSSINLLAISMMINSLGNDDDGGAFSAIQAFYSFSWILISRYSQGIGTLLSDKIGDLPCFIDNAEGKTLVTPYVRNTLNELSQLHQYSIWAGTLLSLIPAGIFCFGSRGIVHLFAAKPTEALFGRAQTIGLYYGITLPFEVAFHYLASAMRSHREDWIPTVANLLVVNILGLLSGYYFAISSDDITWPLFTRLLFQVLTTAAIALIHAMQTHPEQIKETIINKQRIDSEGGFMGQPRTFFKGSQSNYGSLGTENGEGDAVALEPVH